MRNRVQLWRIIAKCAAILYALLAAWICYSAIDSIRRIPLNGWLFVASFALMMLAVGALFFWLAWRLWARWSASTVRWTAGTTLAVILLFTLGFLDEWLHPRGLEWLHAVSLLILFVAGAIAFRLINRKIIAHAKLDEPLDLLGRPMGHTARVRIFCTLLGWAVFYASVMVAHEMREIEGRSEVGWLFVLGPAVLGYSVYKITLWWMTPKTTTALPAGGFEVIPREIGKADEPNVR